VQRRAAVSAALGLGNCDGKQLLRQLNMYGFSRDTVAKALQAVSGMELASSACKTLSAHDGLSTVL